MKTLTSLVLVLICQTVFAQKNCGTSSYLDRVRAEYSAPSFRNNLSFAAPQSSNTGASSSELSSQTVVTIPVVVHVLFNANANVTDEQIKLQIEALNRNFNKENEDFSKVPAVFASLAGVANIRFVLAKVDPNGRATNGITRTKSSRELWSNDDKMKMPSYGGVAPWDSKSYLNIWVCNLVPGLLGYSSAPGSPADKDGVVIKFNIFGTTSDGNFNMGRTTVHEVGHWLNLKHLWGDKECGSDEVDDTPQQRTYNQGTPTFPKMGMGCSASNPYGEMFMNFMDFTNDASMMMFTNGQVKRMRDLFNAGGIRETIRFSKALGEPWNNSPVAANNSGTNTGTVTQPAPLVVIAAVKLYPNPAVDKITLSATNENSIAGKTYAVYAADGRAVSTGTISSNVFNLNISSMHRGIYFISIGETADKQVLRFVKQ
jgi:Pregnancy-associated plasma protein-A/Secretion system C-terminal sorting domain